MSENHQNNSSASKSTEVFSLKEYFQTCVRNWIWFLISLIVCGGLGFLYIKCQEPEYRRSEEILIKDQETSGGMSSAFASMGLISGKTNVYNELISISSPSILSEVINRLKLNENYEKKGGLHPTTLYGTDLPFYVEFLDLDLQEAADFRCTVHKDGSMTLDKFISYSPEGKKIKQEGKITSVKKGSTVKTPVGNVKFTPNPDYAGNTPDDGKEVVIEISKMGHQAAIEAYSKKIQSDLKDEYADVIELVMTDVSIEREVAVLSEILTVYNENWVEDKNKIAKATSAFIEDRLRVIEQDLGKVDENIAKYYSKNETYKLDQKGTALVDRTNALENQMVNLNNNLTLCRYMFDYLKDPSNEFNIIPVNTGVQSEEVEVQINSYNELLLSRNALEGSSSVNNPLVKDYDKQLASLRSAIRKGMSNRIMQLEQHIASIKSEQAKAKNSLLETPMKSLPLLSEQRQQSVKENLYLFLLQKREENELNQKFTADNTRVITPPMGSLRPVSPKKMLILLFAVVIGGLIPLLVIYLRQINDTKVRGKKDLDVLKLPFAGEIPEVDKSKKRKFFDSLRKIKHPKEEKAPLAVVEEGKRDVVNEAFRVIRSNIDFMSAGDPSGCLVILITSFNPGSGKSFISYNLGMSFALKKKRVLVIDCDLRHGSSSMYVGMPNKGVTDYLRHAIDDWHSLIRSSSSTPSIDILPVGKIPPNPVELLENGRLQQLVDQARKEYDVVLLDCPPVNIVVDTQIVAQCADRTLFIVRAGLLERSALSELNEFYDQKQFKNMSVLLNGTEATHSRYYTYGTYQNFNK